MVSKKTPISIFCDVLIYLSLGIFALLCIFPFWNMLVYSISDPTMVSQGVTFWPKGLSTYNYEQVLKIDGIAGAFGISVLRVVLGTVLTVFCCSMLGYLFSKNEMPAHKLLYRLLIVTMYLSGGLIPTYLLMRSYGLLNTFWIYVLPSAVSAYNVILIKTFIEQLPASLEEAATIDGAGYFQVFTRVIFPLSIPIVATIAIFSAVNQWNAWFDNHIYNQGVKSLTTLQYMLYKMLNESKTIAELLKSSSGSVQDAAQAAQASLTPKSVRITTTMIAAIPIFLVYPFMQRYFIKGIMIGAVKG